MNSSSNADFMLKAGFVYKTYIRTMNMCIFYHLCFQSHNWNAWYVMLCQNRILSFSIWRLKRMGLQYGMPKEIQAVNCTVLTFFDGIRFFAPSLFLPWQYLPFRFLFVYLVVSLLVLAIPDVCRPYFDLGFLPLHQHWSASVRPPPSACFNFPLSLSLLSALLVHNHPVGLNLKFVFGVVIIVHDANYTPNCYIVWCGSFCGCVRINTSEMLCMLRNCFIHVSLYCSDSSFFSVMWRIFNSWSETGRTVRTTKAVEVNERIKQKKRKRGERKKQTEIHRVERKWAEWAHKIKRIFFHTIWIRLAYILCAIICIFVNK